MIGLTAFSNMSKDQDVAKQLASMRTYLNTLKAEIESELNHISYENLDGNLRQRIDKIDDSYVQVKRDSGSSTAPTGYISAEELNAKYLRKTEGDTKYLKISTFNNKAITTDNLSQQSINASQLTGTINVSLIDLEALLEAVTGTRHHVKWVSDGNGEYILKGYD